jgi:hypothetical protein
VLGNISTGPRRTQATDKDAGLVDDRRSRQEQLFVKATDLGSELKPPLFKRLTGSFFFLPPQELYQTRHEFVLILQCCQERLLVSKRSIAEKASASSEFDDYLIDHLSMSLHPVTHPPREH